MKLRFLRLPTVWGMLVLLSGCVTLFGWDIHGLGILSTDFSWKVKPVSARVALYLDPQVWNYTSTNRGGRFADPQKYYVGESYVPMIIEGFQTGFDEFIFLEVEPTEEILKQYGIQYVAVVKINSFGNEVTLKGQMVGLKTETVVLDANLQKLTHFQSTGSSDAEKIFSKKGGPEVNLNAALENNILSMVLHLQDSIQTGRWQ